MSSSALERCVGDTAAFLENRWGRRSLHVPASRDHGDLIAPADFDALIARSLLPSAAFRLVRDGSPIPERIYTRKFGGRRAEQLLVADPTLVWDEFYGGATIVLEGLHKYWSPLTEFCRRLESDLGHPTQVNAYITPPGSQGFARHVDVHDVFVLQIHGEKLWEVADEVGSDDLQPVHLRAGDTLYVPTDCAHSARTSGQPSIHLTVGVLVQTWGDVISDLFDMAKSDPVFAERLPVERDRQPGSVESLAKEASRRMQEWFEDLDPETVEARLRRRLLTNRHERNEGRLVQLLALPGLNDSTSIDRIQEGEATRSGATITLLLDDRELQLPDTVREALDFVLARDAFVVEELQHYLDEPGRLAFVGRLIREGLLAARLES